MILYTQRYTVSKYNVHPGKFRCQVCNMEVTSLRHYIDNKELTWMCNDKHISRVSLETKKSKKDYEREERE